MAFQPRINEATGKPCCVQTLDDGRRKLPASPCPKCAEHFGRTPRAATLRATENFTPPDPYHDGIERLRRDLPTNRWPDPPTTRPTTPGDFTPPDPYRAGLDKMRKENR